MPHFSLPSGDAMTVLFADGKHKYKNFPVLLHKHVTCEYSGNLSHKFSFTTVL